MHIFQRIIFGLLGIVVGFALFLLPDMVAVLDEVTSVIIKIILAALLVLFGIVSLRKQKILLATFAFSTCAALLALVAFGSVIRLEELGIV